MRRTVAVAAALLACGAARAGFDPAAPAREPVAADSYAGQASIRLWGGAARPDFYAERVALHDENGALRADFWEGAIAEGDLTTALAGGLEVAWGVSPGLKVLAAFEASGASARGAFTGKGPKVGQAPDGSQVPQHISRLDRMTETGQEFGLTLLLREFGWCRFGLTGRLGVHELAGAVERGRETGLLSTHWWNRNLAGIAPSAAAALEWEWLTPAAWSPIPLTGFVLVGWRWLEFGRVTFAYTDDQGVTIHGGFNNPDGTHRVLSFTGPEVRLGLQACWTPLPLN